MQHRSRIQPLALVCSILLCVGSAWPLEAETPASAGGATQSGRQSNQEHLDFNSMLQLVSLADDVRSAPIKEPGIPTSQVNGQWEIAITDLPGHVFIGTYRLPPKYKFYIQASVCELKGKDSQIHDPTILGYQETAATFYAANQSFYGRNDLDYIECLIPGEKLSSQVTGTPRKTELYTSDERVLMHMCNWLRFFVLQDDIPRSADFAPFILNQYRSLLLAAIESGDNQDVVLKLGFINRTFPFEILEQNIPMAADGRAQVRDFFQTELYICNKLKPLSPDAANQIPRAESLLKRYQ